MLEENDIQERIEIIFQQEKDNISNGHFFYYLDNSNPDMPIKEAVFKHDDIFKATSLELSLMQAKPKILVWDTYSTLKKLYNKVETDCKSRASFLKIINEKLIENWMEIVLSYPRMSASLAFYFLVKIGKADEAVETLKQQIKYYGLFSRTTPNVALFSPNKINDDFFIQGLLIDIYIFTAMEPAYFSDYSLSTLKSLNTHSVYLAGTLKEKERFERHINHLRYSNLKTELRGINEELNIDKEKVIEIIAKYNFPPEMEEFLLQIDLIPESDEWDPINSGMIGNLRSFYEELVRNIAESIKEEIGDEFPHEKNRSEMGNKRLYIKKYLALTDSDNKLIDSYVNILHQEGGHSFISEKKYYRLTKNIGIEIAYFLMSKLESFLDESSSKV